MKAQLRNCVLAGMLLGLAACGGKGAGGDGVTVKIGSVEPVTGPIAHLGKDSENGSQLAVDEANARGVTIDGKKVTFQLVKEDDQSDPRTATIVAQKLVDEGVTGVIGHLNSGTTIPASKIYSDAGIPQISPSATAIAYTQQGYKTTFRVMANDNQQGSALGNYATKVLNARKIAIIDDRTAYGQGLADVFAKVAKANGATIVDREYTTNQSTDFMAILTAIKARQPDLVFYGGMDAQAAPMVKQMRELGIHAQFLGGDGMQTTEFIRLAGPAADGVIGSSPGLPIDQMPGGKTFRQKFESKYGKIQIYSPYAYDATATMIDAMAKANSSDPAKYLPVLASIQRTGVTGPIAFDGKGDIKGGAVTIYQVKQGTWTPLQSIAHH